MHQKKFILFKLSNDTEKYLFDILKDINVKVNAEQIR